MLADIVASALQRLQGGNEVGMDHSISVPRHLAHPCTAVDAVGAVNADGSDGCSGSSACCCMLVSRGCNHVMRILAFGCGYMCNGMFRFLLHWKRPRSQRQIRRALCVARECSYSCTHWEVPARGTFDMEFYHSISFGCCHSVRDIVRAQQQGTQDVQLNEHTNDHYCLSPLAHINIACQLAKSTAWHRTHCIPCSLCVCGTPSP